MTFPRGAGKAVHGSKGIHSIAEPSPQVTDTLVVVVVKSSQDWQVLREVAEGEQQSSHSY